MSCESHQPLFSGPGLRTGGADAQLVCWYDEECVSVFLAVGRSWKKLGSCKAKAARNQGRSATARDFLAQMKKSERERGDLKRVMKKVKERERVT